MRCLLVALVIAISGCHSIQPPAENDAPRSPAGWRVPRNIFREVVRHAQAGDRAAIDEILEGLLLTREEMIELFGAEVGERVWRGYHEVIVPDLRKEAVDVILARVDEGLTEIEVDRLGPARPQNTTPGDGAMLEAMHKKRPMFNVRLQRPGEVLGLRFDGFIYLNGHWKMLLKSYVFLEPPADAGPP